MFAVEIKNSELERRIKEFAKEKQKGVEELISEAIKQFLDKHANKNKLVYTKLDPMKHIVQNSYEYDEELCDDVALTHITDSAKYVHDLRRRRKNA